MTGRFEAHITLDKTHATEVAKVADSTGWTFSQITGCPLLGPGTYCYLTGYNTDDQKLMEAMDDNVVALAHKGIVALRLKIERIVYDTKTNVNEVGK